MTEHSCCCGGRGMDERSLHAVEETIRKWKDTEGALIPVLHEIQDTYGYLPEPALRLTAEELSIPLAEIYGVATFYSYFSLMPKGEHVIRVCLGTACYVKGSQAILDRLAQELGIKVQGTTADGQFTLDATRCLGACGLAPVLTIDDKVYGRLTPQDVTRILREYRAPHAAKKEEVRA